MAALFCAVYFATIVCVGCAVSALILRHDRRSIVEIAGLSITLGVGTLSILLLLISLCGQRPDRMVTISIGVLSLLIIGVLAKSRAVSLPALPTFARGRVASHFLLVVPLLVLLGGLFICTVISTAFPIFDWDALAIWGFKAKLLYLTPLYPRPWYFDEVRYSATHLDYPLLMPMSLAGAYGTMRQQNEPLARFIFPLLLAGQILILYTGARMFLSRVPALFITAATTCAPLSIQQASLGSADLHLATFIAGAAVYLMRWSRFHSRADAVLAALFSLFAALTKSEGLPLAFILAALFLASWAFSPLRKPARPHPIVFATILFSGIAIWLIYRAGIPHIDENYPAQIRPTVLISNSSRAFPILGHFVRHMSAIRNFGALWLLVPLIALLGLRAFGLVQAKLLWALLLSQLALYWFAYLITPWDFQELIGVTIDRLLMHMAPTAGLIIALHWSVVAECNEQVPAH